MSDSPTDTPTIQPPQKAPQTWAEFLAWAADPKHGGPHCQCGKANCCVSFPWTCPACSYPLKVGIHTARPTLIIGCDRCGLGVAYLQLVRG